MSEAGERSGTKPARAALPPAWERPPSLGKRIGGRAVLGLLALLRALPYAQRIALAGRLGRAAYLTAEMRGRIEANLDLVMPQLDAAARRRVALGALDNVARTAIEILSPEEAGPRIEAAPIEGHLEALIEARAAGRPVVLAGYHFGNFTVPARRLAVMGMGPTCIFRPLNNPVVNAVYAPALAAISASPVLPRGRKANMAVVRTLARGGVVGTLTDLFVHEGTELPFMGVPTRTATTAAELALRFDALLLPVFGRRRRNGLDFELIIDAPIPHSEPLAMTRAVGAALERMIARHPEQWFWMHRRWKTLD